MSKIAVTKVELTFTESDRFQCSKEYPKVFSSMEEANLFLRTENRIAVQKRDAGEMLGYFKTDFAITFANGVVYKGRYDIGSDHSDLTNHIVCFNEVYGGIRKPNRMTEEHWAHFKEIYKECASEARELLENYELA